MIVIRRRREPDHMPRHSGERRGSPHPEIAHRVDKARENSPPPPADDVLTEVALVVAVFLSIAVAAAVAAQSFLLP
jgi:hypothetical protein